MTSATAIPAPFVPQSMFRSIETNGIDNAAIIHGQKKQRLYRCEQTVIDGFTALRRTGFEYADADADLVWLEISTFRGSRMGLGVTPSYFFETGGIFIRPSMKAFISHSVPGLLDLAAAAVSELMQFFDWRVKGFFNNPNPNPQVQDQLTFRHPAGHALVLVGDKESLDEAESYLRFSDLSVISHVESLKRAIQFKSEVHLCPVKSLVTEQDITSLQAGDLIRLVQKTNQHDTLQILAFCKVFGSPTIDYLEVFLNMNESDSSLEMGFNDLDNFQSEPLSQRNVRGEEEITLSVLVGKTAITFDDLCNLDMGALIGLDEKSLPIVKVMAGEHEVFEGELVMLNEEVMVQITKVLHHHDR